MCRKKPWSRRLPKFGSCGTVECHAWPRPMRQTQSGKALAGTQSWWVSNILATTLTQDRLT
ncbi:hypothetical protein BOSE62_30362 [Bosea sp. 62]|nr:hypothetical protein BOSE46_130170 [Bosea sp. 46]CAD5267086.1 hypothetical protein BOSE21B_111255 [Bosea sp. 21B]CAD5272144.1 hypothetical protein BOSE7B_30140 [Bosea sp. 7B]VVT55967.1 hypothetical protein BOS5A_130073 [Bosea sp. EC-HK365B]VXB83686.1 hypothetical protein BOSE29B_130100 [Bosea sp. 29B]VXC19424.1 hypothetical protein BOSE62_30362 [Bosea sp. 62]VXC22426.1 hypothetical protein BOSE125_180225 [Bosea sp. 125]VXC69700.1 hypothetical protein BOSE127_40138 [Bosea sp. 127]